MLRHRKNMRLPCWDYSWQGYYFVTICTQNRQEYFIDPDINDMIKHAWYELKQKYEHIILDKFVVMPDHIHGIINIVGADLCVRPESGSTHRSTPTLGEMIRWFKTMTTNYYIRGINQFGWKPFPGKLWQRNYYDHIIRNEASLHRMRLYITHNPAQGDQDKEI